MTEDQQKRLMSLTAKQQEEFKRLVRESKKVKEGELIPDKLAQELLDRIQNNTCEEDYKRAMKFIGW